MKMKKWKLILGIIIFVSALNISMVSAKAERTISLNYNYITLGQSQIIIEGSTQVPLKSLAAEMGYLLSWDQITKTYKLIRPDREVIFKVGSKSVTINGVVQALTESPSIIKGTTYVPLVSAVSAFGGKISVEQNTGNLNIVDEIKFTVVSLQGRSYWVSQTNGDIYYRATTNGKLERIGNLPVKKTAYRYHFEIKETGKGTDLLLIQDNHYAMFNDFSNEYQALVQSGKILK
jgi:hypothetical protein